MVLFSGILYITHYSEMARNDRVYEIYNKIQTVTGQSQDRLPLFIIENETQNAYCDGTKIVIFTGLLDVLETDDQIAMVLAHETAHQMLGHLSNYKTDRSPNSIAVMEANADKMGAFYIMASGYDVCKGREFFKYWKEQNGNSLGGDHPDYSYRYAELNINCD